MIINTNKTDINKIILLDNLKINKYLVQTNKEIKELEIKKFLKISLLKENKEYKELKTKVLKNELEKSIKNPFNLVLKELSKEKENLFLRKENNLIFLELVGY